MIKMKNNMIRIDDRSLSSDIPAAEAKRRLFILFSKHIGNEKGIYMNEIYNNVYKEMDTKSKLIYIFRCRNIIEWLAQLRKNTLCFVVSEKDEDGRYYWYVLKTKDELKEYHNTCDGKIKGIEKMKEKALLHVKNKNWLGLR